MELGDTTISMEKAEAEEQLASYRTLKAPSEEERAIVAGLMALAAGKSLVNLRAAVAAGGEFEAGLPRIAAMDANRMWCYCGRLNTGSLVYSAHARVDDRMKNGIIRLREVLEPRNDLAWQINRSSSFEYRSQVPIVPPQHRPPRFSSGAQYTVLWEVEEWAKAPRPPGDPALLRHVTGDLYSIEAEWDLTDLERAVLAARDV